METKPEIINANVLPSVTKTKKIKKQQIIIEDDKKSFIQKYSRQKRIRILYKIICLKQIENAIQKCNIKK